MLRLETVDNLVIYINRNHLIMVVELTTMLRLVFTEKTILYVKKEFLDALLG